MDEIIKMADAHAHLDALPAFKPPSDFIVFTSGYSHESNVKNAEIARSLKNTYASLGIAPQTAQQYANLAEKLPEWTAYIRSQKPVAIGEAGLDFHWGKTEELTERQRMCFEEMIKLAQEMRLPLVIHCRDAYKEVLETLETHLPIPFMLHCFSGNEKDAKKAVEMGGIISIPPMKSRGRADAISEIGIPFLVAETDSPYIGKTPLDVSQSIRIISTELEIKEEEAAIKTCENALKFFGVRM